MEFELAIQVIQASLKKIEDPHKAFYKILKEVEEIEPGKVWGRLPYDLDKDIAAATQWIEAEFKSAGAFTGIYFGLDTLNMNDGTGTNVEIAFSSQCVVDDLEDDSWLSVLDVRGSSHLIRGLYDMQQVYGNEKKYAYEIRSFVEYVVFLGYSGVVLGAGLKHADHAGSYLAQWGYHDGDLFWLAQKMGSAITLIPDSKSA